MLAKARITFFVAFAFTFGASFLMSPGAAAKTAEKAETPPQTLPLEQLRTFVEILDRVEKDYVEPVSDKEMIENAIRGMINSLDPHSAYLDPKEFKEMSITTSGKFGGLGIEVQMQDGFVRVISPIDDTPAQRAGIKAGDLIVRINDKPVKGMSLNDAVNVMRGDPGSKISLTILRQGRTKPLTVQLTRAVIRVKSVKSRLLEPGYGYLRITQFSSDTADNLTDALKQIQSKNGGPLKGLVLDLRNNPGGLLNAAVKVSDAFLSSGVVVSIKGRTEQSNQIFSATPGDSLHGVPIVTLINGGTASAAEIVAGALKDHKRALIVGTRSFGKGSVQTVMPLQDGGAIKLTTARYYTPSGLSIQAEGIEPDITIIPLKVTEAEGESSDHIKEADLLGRLDNDTTSPAEAHAAAQEDQKIVHKESELARTDYQLYQSLNLLKSMSFLQSRNP